MLLSIIIPLYNEQDNVDILYKEIRESADLLEKPYEIIFVDDGSSDSTLEGLKGILRREKGQKGTLSHTRIIRFTRNFGQTAAMQAGFDFANGEIVVTMDGDLQNDPKDIPRLLAKIDEGYGVVCGWRRDRKDKALSRILPSKVANWIIAKITGVPIHDNGCSLKAYKRSVIKHLTLYSDMHRFIPSITKMVGANITEIVVNHRPRKAGRTKYGLSRTWKVLFDIITVKMLLDFRHRPILWFASFGSIFLLLGVGLGIVSFLQLLQGEGTIVSLGATFLSLCLFGMLLSFGFLSEFFVKMEKAQKVTAEMTLKK